MAKNTDITGVSTSPLAAAPLLGELASLRMEGIGLSIRGLFSM
ncbi:MAG: hypothetical protein WCG95_07230 [bacterium]